MISVNNLVPAQYTVHSGLPQTTQMTRESNISLAGTQKRECFQYLRPGPGTRAPSPTAVQWPASLRLSSDNLHDHQGRNEEPRPLGQRTSLNIAVPIPSREDRHAHRWHLCLQFRLTRKWALNTGHKSAEDSIPTVPLSEHWPF